MGDILKLLPDKVQFLFLKPSFFIIMCKDFCSLWLQIPFPALSPVVPHQGTSCFDEARLSCHVPVFLHTLFSSALLNPTVLSGSTLHKAFSNLPNSVYISLLSQHFMHAFMWLLDCLMFSNLCLFW